MGEAHAVSTKQHDLVYNYATPLYLKRLNTFFMLSWFNIDYTIMSSAHNIDRMFQEISKFSVLFFLGVVSSHLCGSSTV